MWVGMSCKSWVFKYRSWPPAEIHTQEGDFKKENIFCLGDQSKFETWDQRRQVWSLVS